MASIEVFSPANITIGDNVWVKYHLSDTVATCSPVFLISQSLLKTEHNLPLMAFDRRIKHIMPCLSAHSEPNWKYHCFYGLGLNNCYRFILPIRLWESNVVYVLHASQWLLRNIMFLNKLLITKMLFFIAATGKRHVVLKMKLAFRVCLTNLTLIKDVFWKFEEIKLRLMQFYKYDIPEVTNRKMMFFKYPKDFNIM